MKAQIKEYRINKRLIWNWLKERKTTDQKIDSNEDKKKKQNKAKIKWTNIGWLVDFSILDFY